MYVVISIVLKKKIFLRKIFFLRTIATSTAPTERVEQTLIKFANALQEILALGNLPAELAWARSRQLLRKRFSAAENLFLNSYRTKED